MTLINLFYFKEMMFILVNIWIVGKEAFYSSLNLENITDMQKECLITLIIKM